MCAPALAIGTSILFLLLAPVVEATVVVNEFSPHVAVEWVEFYNASESAEYLKGYYLDDDISFSEDSGSSGIKPLSNLVTSNSTYPYFELSSSIFNNSGDFVVLFNETGTLVDQYEYTNDPGEGMSIGRFPDAAGSWSQLSSVTKGSANTAPPTNTPSPTLTPTHTPNPTKSPTPTQVVIPAKVQTASPTVMYTPSVSVYPTKSPVQSIAVTSGVTQGSSSAMPQEILGVASEDIPNPATQSGLIQYRPYIISLLLVSTGLSMISGIMIWQKRSSITKTIES